MDHDCNNNLILSFMEEGIVTDLTKGWDSPCYGSKLIKIGKLWIVNPTPFVFMTNVVPPLPVLC